MLPKRWFHSSWLSHALWCLYTHFLYWLIYSEHLDRFHTLAIVNSTTVNIGMHVYFWHKDFEYIPSGKITISL